MLIGDINLLHRDYLTDHDVVTLITLPNQDPSPEPPNTIMLTFDLPAHLLAETRTLDGNTRLTSKLHATTLMNGLRLGTTINDMIETLAGPGWTAGHTPLFCATHHHDGWHIYSRAHQRPDRWCFIRTTTTALTPAGDDLSWLPDAVTRHAQNAGVLNTHQCTVAAAPAGKEVETKFTLPTDTPIWPLALDIHDRMTAGDIPAMAPRFGQDIEMCDYDNYLFQVTAPTEQRGYVSFMNARPGKYWIKRKQFTADSLICSESVSSEIGIHQPLDTYVRDILHLQGTRLPSFRRIRYDIMFESLATGNHYCLLLDRCTLHDDPDEVLVQCEIEYLRSRRVLPLSETLVLSEFAELTAWTFDFLTDHGILAEASYYSKLSFLLDVVTRRLDAMP